ncbi:MAG: hypothetical protein ACRDZP_02185 [Acidimicrobiales bacterium]
MGFMDKMKNQASVLAEKAQEGAKAGQGKLSQIQSKRQADALLLELGGITYLERSGRQQDGADKRADELVSQLRTHEAEHGAVTVTSAVPPPGASGSYVPGDGGTSTPESGTPGGGGIPQSGTPGGGSGGGGGGGGIPSPSYSSDEEGPGS